MRTQEYASGAALSWPGSPAEKPDPDMSCLAEDFANMLHVQPSSAPTKATSLALDVSDMPWEQVCELEYRLQALTQQNSLAQYSILHQVAMVDAALKALHDNDGRDDV